MYVQRYIIINYLHQFFLSILNFSLVLNKYLDFYPLNFFSLDLFPPFNGFFSFSNAPKANPSDFYYSVREFFHLFSSSKWEWKQHQNGILFDRHAWEWGRRRRRNYEKPTNIKSFYSVSNLRKYREKKVLTYFSSYPNPPFSCRLPFPISSSHEWFATGNYLSSLIFRRARWREENIANFLFFA